MDPIIDRSGAQQCVPRVSFSAHERGANTRFRRMRATHKSFVPAGISYEVASRRAGAFLSWGRHGCVHIQLRHRERSFRSQQSRDKATEQQRIRIHGTLHASRYTSLVGQIRRFIPERFQPWECWHKNILRMLIVGCTTVDPSGHGTTSTNPV